MTDDLFRHDANRFFDVACASEGFVFTDEERLALKRLDYDLIERLSIRIDMAIKRSAGFVDFGGGTSRVNIGVDKGNH